YRFINEVPCAPSVPCHVSVSLCGAFVLYAEYSFGTAGVLRIRENDGGLDADTRFSVTHSGKLGPDKERQDRPHCHYIKQAPSGTVYVCDLGTDEVVAYELENAKLRKHANAAFNAAPGAGPRHMIFDAAGKRAYLLNELDNTLVAFDCSGDALRATQTLSTVPAGFSEFSKAAAVKISPSGNWVLASNRGHDSIAAFRISQFPSPPVISKLTGRFPRDFEFSPDGKFVVVGHKLSNEIATYRFNSETGVLTPTGNTFPMTKPLCFAFL
ncbi:MAG: lactonase family protein, partial [Kiritimatiellaeota bacterium]|nr:lactonase family protein [Kiritimatiellota bacterium]